MKSQIHISDRYFSPTKGEMKFDEATDALLRYIAHVPENPYRIIIGTDSQPQGHISDFVSAIVVHRVGMGGIYFWTRSRVERPMSLKERMYEEALRSLIVAHRLLDGLRARSMLELGFEIHVDVGQRGETRTIVQEVVGMIRGSGFEVKIKPDAFGASTVADRHT